VCDLCPPESRSVFPNRAVLWIDHLFEPFLEWVDESLAKAKWLALYGSGGAFGKEEGWILGAMRRALERVSSFDIEARIVSYRAPSQAVLKSVEDLR
jgi:hypothetical protein